MYEGQYGSYKIQQEIKEIHISKAFMPSLFMKDEYIYFFTMYEHIYLLVMHVCCTFIFMN